MVDEYQIEYEYTNGNKISVKADSVNIDIIRPHLRVTTRVDGTRVVTDSGFSYPVITCTAMLSGDDADTLYGVQSGAITYTGAYPRLQKIYWDGDSTETNVEIALVDTKLIDMGDGWWTVSLRFEGKDQ